jgi:DNA modification methylase
LAHKRPTFLNQVHKVDARNINDIIKMKVIDVTITSPPYFDLKDYGHKKQIGFGQDYKDYLDDLKLVFENVYHCTKKTGTLWVIIDAFRQNNEVVPLPFDFSNKIKEVGWKLQDVIIWAKDRTVPWAHKGQMRSMFEYILVFSKTSKYNFFIDNVRDFEVLKKWWVKYPERYNPKGKTPSGLWHYDIPTQGSWGKGYIKHFCPLPEFLIEQILRLTTNEGSVVLDPFAGSGAVLAKAENMKRKYIGFELNGDYIKMFKNYLKKTGQEKRRNYIKNKKGILPQSAFEKLNLNLRALKFGRIIHSKLPKKQRNKIIKIYVDRTRSKPTKKNARCLAKYTFYLEKEIDINKLRSQIETLISKPPLSKFGIEAKFRFDKKLSSFSKSINRGLLFTYTSKVSHKYKSKIKHFELDKLDESEVILSNIMVDLNEKDYE